MYRNLNGVSKDRVAAQTNTTGRVIETIKHRRQGHSREQRETEESEISKYIHHYPVTLSSYRYQSNPQFPKHLSTNAQPCSSTGEATQHDQKGPQYEEQVILSAECRC
jgi:hypothetical protein